MINTEMCPMASMCKGMAQKPGSGYMLMVPGIVFIVAGILIILEPKILVWLIALISILMGTMMLFMANFFRKMNSL